MLPSRLSKLYVDFIFPFITPLFYTVFTLLQASVELDAAALNAAIGLLENTAPPGATLQRAQEDLVEAAKELANGVKVCLPHNSPHPILLLFIKN